MNNSGVKFLYTKEIKKWINSSKWQKLSAIQVLLEKDVNIPGDLTTTVRGWPAEFTDRYWPYPVPLSPLKTRPLRRAIAPLFSDDSTLASIKGSMA